MQLLIYVMAVFNKQQLHQILSQKVQKCQNQMMGGLDHFILVRF